jgi:hypothetical protein
VLGLHGENSLSVVTINDFFLLHLLPSSVLYRTAFIHVFLSFAFGTKL